MREKSNAILHPFLVVSFFVWRRRWENFYLLKFCMLAYIMGMGRFARNLFGFWCIFGGSFKIN